MSYNNYDYPIYFEENKPIKLFLSRTEPVWEGRDKAGRTKYLYIGYQEEPDRFIKFYAYQGLRDTLLEKNVREHQAVVITKRRPKTGTRIDDYIVWEIKKIDN